MANKRIPKLISTGVISLLLFSGLMACDGDDRMPSESEFIEVEPIPDPEIVEEKPAASPCDDIGCEAGTRCVEGVCEAQAAQGYGCADPFNLGLLKGEKVDVLEASPQGQPNLLNTSCSVDNHSAQAIFSFQVDEPMKIDSRIVGSSHILVQELRVGLCTSPGAVSWCTINEKHWTALPGEEYFLIVEARQGDPGADSVVGESGLINDFQLEIATRPYTCYPAGERSCEGGEVQLCAGGDELRSIGCSTGCNGGECLGDSCQNPIEVQGSLSLEAELSSFQHTMDFQDSPSCTSSGATGGGTRTLGQDLVFRLPGLTGGQTVEVEAPSSAFVLAVMDSCNASAPTCLVGDDTTGSLSWEVERSGDYYVVANRFTSSTSPGEFRIEVMD